MEEQVEPDRGTTPRWVWVVGMLFLVVGAAVVWAGAVIGGLSAYVQSVFVNVGTALALIGPLFLAERTLSRRIREVGQRATAAEERAQAAETATEVTRNALEELQQQFREGLADSRRREETMVEQAASGSFEELVDLYRKAADGRSIDRLGLLLAPAGLDYWMRVRAVERAPEGERMWLIELSIEDANLRTIGQTVSWSEGERSVDVFLLLADELRDAGRWPGDAAFDPVALLRSIADALSSVIDIRRGARGDRDVRQIVEVVNDQWAVTREGLDCVFSRNLWADDDELVGDSSDAFQRLEPQVKESRHADLAKFKKAFARAERVHAALGRDNPGRGLLG